jgi:4-coumarate--CoA ligase
LDGSTGLQRTFADHYKATHGIASALRNDMNIREDSTVAMYCPNHVDYLPVALAVSLCGAKMTPINPLYTAFELEKVLELSRSSVLFVHTSKLDVALETAKRIEHVKHIVVITDDGEAVPEGTIDLDSLRNHEGGPMKTIQIAHRDTASHPFLLPYSSGTTGLPKGVVLSHGNIIANLLQCDVIEGIGFSPDHKVISPLPFFHIYAFTVSLLYAAMKGNQIITMSKRFDLETFCQLVQDHKPQRAHLVPPIILALQKSPLVENYDMSSLRMISSAAAPMSPETEEGVKNRIGSDVKQLWGMSELSPVGILTSDLNIKPGSVGQVVSSTTAKVVDEHGKSLGPLDAGELLIKGPQVMLGYLNEPEKTAECLSPSGWLRTGDLAYYDEDGFFFITDRLKELIKVRGYPVAPAELEALLLTHEAISDAAVIQIPDDENGEIPRAYVVLKPAEAGSGVQEKDIYEWVKERVAPYKRLDGGIIFTDAIPKSTSGKILRRILRDQAKTE